MSCESPTLCESLKLSMNQIFFPRRQHLEFNPNVTCPEAPFANTTAWAPISQECKKSDTVCIQAGVEVQTSFAGLKDSLSLDPFAEKTSKGVLRACASRRFLLSLGEPTLEVKADDANETLALILGQRNPPKDRFTIREIFFHHFYLDHGTPDAVKCMQDNCNARDTPSSPATQITSHVLLHIILILGNALTQFRALE